MQLLWKATWFWKGIIIKIIRKGKNKWKKKRLRQEIEHKEDELLNDDSESKISKLLTNLKFEKHDALHDITVLQSKLIKLGITPIQIYKIKESVLSS